MKKQAVVLFVSLLSMSVSAQNTWEKPEDAKPAVTAKEAKEEKSAKAEKKQEEYKYAKYLAGAVPVVDGYVQWTLSIDCPNKSAQEIYDKVYEYMKKLTTSEGQLEGSQIALVNKAEHSIVTTVREWLEFKKTFLSHDRSKVSYALKSDCKNGHLDVTLSRIVFDYTENQGGVWKAEEWITDEEALNKKKTKLLPGSQKFRRKMVDRKDAIFNDLTLLFK
ncbi:MAG: DUF4468 domain-containing protein [Bacteroidaceae bacterium]|nr:DUF4468 domain-containing protein [Bacteroidaceae bacterium]